MELLVLSPFGVPLCLFATIAHLYIARTEQNVNYYFE
jgi:hypothetical protein